MPMPASIRVPENDYIVLKIGKKPNINKITVFGSEFFDCGNRE